MSETIIPKAVEQWIVEFVSKYNEQLGQIPCPFARSAMLQNKIRYKEVNTLELAAPLMQAVKDTWTDDYEVAVFYFRCEVTPAELSALANDFNEKFMTDDFVVLEDHPEDIEEINGVAMNFGRAPLILFQRLSKINAASEYLKKKGYYENWSQENYDDVVSWRYK